MNQEKINLQVSRDFGETFNASIKIMRQNFKMFFQCIIFIAGPFILLSSVAGAFYQSNVLNVQSSLRMTDPTDVLKQFGLTYLLFIIATIISNLAIMATVFSFLINYQEKGPKNFTVSDVARKARQSIGSIIAIFLIVFLLGIAIFSLLGVLIFIIASVVPVLGILFAVLAVLGLLAVCPPILWQL